jgi:hypothetical protein
LKRGEEGGGKYIVCRAEERRRKGGSPYPFIYPHNRKKVTGRGVIVSKRTRGPTGSSKRENARIRINVNI